MECFVFVCYPTRFSRNKLDQVQKWKGIPVRYFSGSSIYPNTMFKRLIQLLRGVFNCTWFCLTQANNFDAFFFSIPRWVDSIVGLRLCSARGGVVFVDQTELFSAGVNTLLHKLEERLIAKYSSTLFTISKRLQQYYQEQFSKTTILLPIVVNFSRFNSEILVESRTIGYVGSFGSKDGVDLILDGFEQACKTSNLPLKLKLIGSPHSSETLVEKIKQKDLSNRVELIINPSNQQINQLLPKCDTFIMNRTNSEFAKYGYPTKLGEYFACKRSVLMSEGPGFSEDYSDKVEAIKYEVENPQALADAIIWRYNNPDEADIIAQRGYDYAKKHFDSEVVGQIMSNAIENAS